MSTGHVAGLRHRRSSKARRLLLLVVSGRKTGENEVSGVLKLEGELRSRN